MESSSSSTNAGCASDLDWLCCMAGSVTSFCIECMSRCSCVAGRMLSQGWKVRRLERRVTTLPLTSMLPVFLRRDGPPVEQIDSSSESTLVSSASKRRVV